MNETPTMTPPETGFSPLGNATELGYTPPKSYLAMIPHDLRLLFGERTELVGGAPAVVLRHVDPDPSEQRLEQCHQAHLRLLQLGEVALVGDGCVQVFPSALRRYRVRGFDKDGTVQSFDVMRAPREEPSEGHPYGKATWCHVRECKARGLTPLSLERIT